MYRHTVFKLKICEHRVFVLDNLIVSFVSKSSEIKNEDMVVSI